MARNRLADHIGLAPRHDPLLDVLVQSEHDLRPLSDGERRAGDDWHERALESLARDRKRGADPRAVAGDDLAGVIGQQPQDAIGGGRGQEFAGPRPPLPYPVDPDLPIRIDHDLDDQAIGQGAGDHRPHGLAKRGDLAVGDDGMVL